MSKLEDLIQKYCPNGVEKVELGKVCDINGRIGFRGYTRADQVGAGEGAISLSPANIINGRINYKDCTYISWKKYEESPEIMVKNGDIIFCKTASVGKVAFIENLQEKATINPQLVLLNNFKCNSKFLLYILSNNTFQNIVRSMQGIGSVPNIGQGKLSQISIPLPPLPVQEEIVRILDAMTDLQENLEKELEERRKQYAFYRDKLLSFNGLTTPPSWRVEWKQLGELFELRNGYTPSKNNNDFWENGTIPWFRMEDIRTNGRILNDSMQHVTESAIKNCLFPANSIIVATSATIGEHALITVPSLSNQRFTYLVPKKEYGDKIIMKYMFYYMFLVDEWCKTHTLQGNFAGVDMSAFRELPIPLPSLSIQQEIVEKLDTMEELVSNIENELTERKKQYEYYREKSFLFAK